MCVNLVWKSLNQVGHNSLPVRGGAKRRRCGWHHEVLNNPDHLGPFAYHYYYYHHHHYHCCCCRHLPSNHPLTRLQPRLSSSPLVDIPSPTPESTWNNILLLLLFKLVRSWRHLLKHDLIQRRQGQAQRPVKWASRYKPNSDLYIIGRFCVCLSVCL